MTAALERSPLGVEAAQEVALRLARAGIEGIWNFTGCPLLLPRDVIVQDQDIAIGLAVLSAKLSALARAGHSLPPEGDPD